MEVDIRQMSKGQWRRWGGAILSNVLSPSVYMRAPYLALVLLTPLLTSCCKNPTLTGILPPPAPFTLQPGDEIEVRFAYFPELSDTQVIRPDGKISLSLIDDVLVAGLSPEEVDFLLTKLYEEKVKDPELTVVVRALENQRVFMGGEALLPGAIRYRPGMTVLDALMEGGGWLPTTAAPSQVAVYRLDQTKGIRVGTTVDVKKEVESSYSKPFYLAANDIIYVPESDISKANRWVEQNINSIVPAPGVVGVSEARGKSAVSASF